MIKLKRADFVAAVGHVWEKTRFKDSGFMCTVVQGGIHKGDVVQLLDSDGDFIVEEEVKTISYSQRTFEEVQKGASEKDIVILEFKHIWEYPIQQTKYIVKMADPASVKLKKDVKLPANNDIPYEQLITRAVDIEEFVDKFYIYPLSMNLGYYLPDIYTSIGIECLRETEEGAIYSVHKVVQGGLLYIFYARIPGSRYVKVADWYYVQKRLSHKDFQSLGKGSTLQEVVSIDPAARIYEKVYQNDSFTFDISDAGLSSFHFLTDGVLKIHYKKQVDEVGEKYIGIDKKIFVDFDNIQSIQPGERIHSLNGRILPMDRI